MEANNIFLQDSGLLIRLRTCLILSRSNKTTKSQIFWRKVIKSLIYFLERNVCFFSSRLNSKAVIRFTLYTYIICCPMLIFSAVPSEWVKYLFCNKDFLSLTGVFLKKLLKNMQFVIHGFSSFSTLSACFQGKFPAFLDMFDDIQWSALRLLSVNCLYSQSLLAVNLEITWFSENKSCYENIW